MTKIISGSDEVIDYQGRLDFLHATTEVMNPPPIDTLLELLPLFRSWFTHVDTEEENQIAVAMLKTFAIANYAVSDSDTSAEAVNLRRAISEWMAKHRFSTADK